MEDSAPPCFTSKLISITPERVDTRMRQQLNPLLCETRRQCRSKQDLALYRIAQDGLEWPLGAWQESHERSDNCHSVFRSDESICASQGAFLTIFLTATNPRNTERQRLYDSQPYVWCGRRDKHNEKTSTNSVIYQDNTPHLRPKIYRKQSLLMLPPIPILYPRGDVIVVTVAVVTCQTHQKPI